MSQEFEVTPISVIVWPEALRLGLQSLASQTERCFEIIIADDGSRPVVDEHAL
jgi:hypothetical protein